METSVADGLALTEVAYVLHAHPGVWTGWTGPLRAFSLASLLQTSVLRGRDSAEAAGCDLPDGFGDNLVVTHGHQEHIFGYYKVSFRDVNRACALKYYRQFIPKKGKINVSHYFCLFDILSRN